MEKVFTGYKPGDAQKAQSSGPLAAGGSVDFVFDTNNGVGKGTGSFQVTQPGMDAAVMTGTLDGGKTKSGNLSLSYNFPRDLTLVANTRHVVRVTVDNATQGITGKLLIQGFTTPRAA